MLETPELGRLDHEHVCGRLADAWNARRDVEPLAQVESALRSVLGASIDHFDLAVDRATSEGELTLDEGRDGLAWLVEGCDAVLDECVAGVDEFPQGLDRLAGGGARLEFENCAHAGKQGVTPVSLGKFSCGLGVSGPDEVDLDQGQAEPRSHRLLEQAMVNPYRLENDSGDIEYTGPFDEGAMAFRIVRDAKALAARMDRHVESVFQENVDADALRYRWPRLSKSSSCLKSGPGCPFRPLGKGGVVKLQVEVLSDWRAYDPSPPTAGLCR